MGSYDTLLVEREGPVGWLIFNRPQVGNAMNHTMMDELERAWHELDADPAVRVIVNTGEGKTFQTGLDVAELSRDPDALREQSRRTRDAELAFTAWHLKVWKPVIAAVNGIACGGAFYLLGEVEFIIAADHATFFDPHVTYGMPAVFEPTLMASRMPFGEIMRISLMGNHERLSAARAHEIGLVSEVVPRADLLETARWAAAAIASAPPNAVQATLRTLWATRELGRNQAIELGNAFLNLGMSQQTMAEGQAVFASGRRITPRVR
jgi:enoyl-CoA hydratase/carnithine racemase